MTLITPGKKSIEAMEGSVNHRGENAISLLLERNDAIKKS
tara:strand:- start:1634 stop:1753 length:120 start_codon:yes stop_codon:yes gene_type:complete